MAIVSPDWTASASRFAPLSMSAKQEGSGRKSRSFGSRWRARSSRATPRASSSSSIRASMPRLSSVGRRQRHGWPLTDRSMLSAVTSRLYPGEGRGPAQTKIGAGAPPGPRPSPGNLRLADLAQQLGEPGHRYVELLAAGDPLELD